MGFENDHRASIARRNQRRALEERDYKLTITMFSIVGYLGFTNLIGGVAGALHVKEGGVFAFQAVVDLVLCALYVAAAREVWFKQLPRWRLVVLPATISIVLAAAFFRINYLTILPFLLGVTLIALIPARLKARNALNAIPKD
jgi:hypothetical protein